MMGTLKGCNQHVFPCKEGWCVVDESNQHVLHNFAAQEDALAYAHGVATVTEGEVLLHTTPFTPGCLPCVSLPQREVFPENVTVCHEKDHGVVLSV